MIVETQMDSRRHSKPKDVRTKIVIMQAHQRLEIMQQAIVNLRKQKHMKI